MALAISPIPEAEPLRDCPLCPRLVVYREACRTEHPDWWNGPVQAFGDRDAWLAIVGLAPGKHGANRTGRPFTGDFSGNLLFDTLLGCGLARGRYDPDGQDDLRLEGAIILNSVKCLPPQNKPTPAEAATCRRFYVAGLALLKNVHMFVPLGRIAHDTVVRTAGGKLANYRFGHLAEHVLPDERIMIDSYHCSRYNQNTGRLTAEAFAAVFARALELRKAPAA